MTLHRGLVLLPALLGLAGWVVLRAGWLGEDHRVTAQLSAPAASWVLVLGLVLTALAAVPVAVGSRGDARHRRVVAARDEGSARERRLLLGRLDHELKNPLMAVRAAVANAAAAGPGADQARALRSIEEQTLRLSRLTADLRKIADIGTSPLDRRPVDLTALLEEAVEIVLDQPAAAGRQVKLDLPRAPWPLPAISGDMDLLTLAVVNLVDNAVKYTPPGGTIEVRAREASGRVLVEVADTGPGIAPEDLPHIWEELYRSPQTRAVPGSGLGLPLVRAVVERHGGSVSAESRLGRGTAVRVQLPVSAPA